MGCRIVFFVAGTLLLVVGLSATFDMAFFHGKPEVIRCFTAIPTISLGMALWLNSMFGSSQEPKVMAREIAAATLWCALYVALSFATGLISGLGLSFGFAVLLVLSSISSVIRSLVRPILPKRQNGTGP